jgi:hypothetical protein
MKIEDASLERLQERLHALCGDLPLARERIRSALAEDRTRLEEQYDHLFGMIQRTAAPTPTPRASLIESRSR